MRSCSASAICLARASAASRSRSQASAASRRRAYLTTYSARAATRAVARAESGRAAVSDEGGGVGKELVLVPAPTILLVGDHGGMPKGKGGATAPTTRSPVASEVGSTTVQCSLHPWQHPRSPLRLRMAGPPCPRLTAGEVASGRLQGSAARPRWLCSHEGRRAGRRRPGAARGLAARGLAARACPWLTAGRSQCSGGGRHLCPGGLKSRELAEVGWRRRGRRPASHGARGGGPGGLTGQQRRWKVPGGWEEGGRETSFDTMLKLGFSLYWANPKQGGNIVTIHGPHGPA